MTPHPDPAAEETPLIAIPSEAEVLTLSPVVAAPERWVLKLQVLLIPSSRLKPGAASEPVEPDACSAPTETSVASVQQATASASARRLFREWNMVPPFPCGACAVRRQSCELNTIERRGQSDTSEG